ncbi:MAG: sulfatase [Bacteroidota bacterium]
MRTRAVWFIWVALMFGLYSSCEQSEPPVPNVVFILADDLGVNDLSYNNADFYDTPHIDALAANGTVFTNGYAAAAVCSPSRASIMTGQSTAVHGITDWIGARWGQDWGDNHPYTRLSPPDYQKQLDTTKQTLAKLFKASGYSTFFAGKWHLGPVDSWPTNHGFDINKGGWDSGSPVGGYFTPYSNPNLEDGPDGENLSMRLARETAQFIRTKSDQPFFAFLSFYAVHGPIQTTREKWKKYRQKAIEKGVQPLGFGMERRLPIRLHQDNPIYAGLVEQMDDAVGLVIDELKRQGIYENTIIIFTSDNGGVASGDAYSTSNRPFRGGKGYQWEGGIRVPYIIKSVADSSRRLDVPVSGQDFLPTLASMCQLDLSDDQIVDGVDLSPLWANNEITDRPLFWHYPHYGNQGGDPVSMMRSGNMKLIYYWETEEVELYDLSADRGESRNLVKGRPAEVQKMKDQLFNWLENTQAGKPTENEAFDEGALQARREYILNTLSLQLENQRKNQLSISYQPDSTWWGSYVND